MAGNIPFINIPSSELMTGEEIQPQVLTQNHIDEISQCLREQIMKSIIDMKALSTTEGGSESPHAQFLVPPQEVTAALDETTKKIGGKTAAKVVGKLLVSYEVPRICIEKNIDLDNSVSYDESNNKRRQYSFTQRLQKWKLEKRQRGNGKMHDVYYIHGTSRVTFRSMKEVLNFMIFEKYPKPSNEKDKKLEVGEGSNEEESFRREERKGDEEIDELAGDREKVVKFLHFL
ncbi:hypothetical protein K1719_028940 [Acacia pycnantha]|nr:hypothetical protein K1719_028940 [Acacia pycnantha]